MGANEREYRITKARAGASQLVELQSEIKEHETKVRCTATALAKAMATLPAPDAGYRAAVEEAANRQGKVPESPWES